MWSVWNVIMSLIHHCQLDWLIDWLTEYLIDLGGYGILTVWDGRVIFVRGLMAAVTSVSLESYHWLTDWLIGWCRPAWNVKCACCPVNVSGLSAAVTSVSSESVTAASVRPVHSWPAWDVTVPSLSGTSSAVSGPQPMSTTETNFSLVQAAVLNTSVF